MKILVPLAGLVDKEAELSRLAKQIAKLESDLGKTEVRIGNPNFAKAPEAVQQQARSLAEKQRKDLAVLKEQHSRIQAL
jgi:valyl-tRNA synthetase